MEEAGNEIHRDPVKVYYITYSGSRLSEVRDHYSCLGGQEVLLVESRCLLIVKINSELEEYFPFPGVLEWRRR